MTTQQRFESKYVVNAATQCWEWTACRDGSKRKTATDPRGEYGRFALDGYHMISAHRASYIMFRGPIPEGLEVLHRCDNPPCVNPDHLFLGTNQDNSDDKLAKGRSWHQRPGARSPRFGTGKWLRLNGESVVPASCAVCQADTFQRVDAFKAGQTPVCSQSCKGVLTSRRCRTRVQVSCAECDKPIWRMPCELKRRSVFFCGYACKGRFFMRNSNPRRRAS